MFDSLKHKLLSFLPQNRSQSLLELSKTKNIFPKKNLSLKKMNEKARKVLFTPKKIASFETADHFDQKETIEKGNGKARKIYKNEAQMEEKLNDSQSPMLLSDSRTPEKAKN